MAKRVDVFGDGRVAEVSVRAGAHVDEMEEIADVEEVVKSVQKLREGAMVAVRYCGTGDVIERGSDD